MSAPWDQTSGFSANTLSNPYRRLMNTSGIAFRDHAGSMVSLVLLAAPPKKALPFSLPIPVLSLTACLSLPSPPFYPPPLHALSWGMGGGTGGGGLPMRPFINVGSLYRCPSIRCRHPKTGRPPHLQVLPGFRRQGPRAALEETVCQSAPREARIITKCQLSLPPFVRLFSVSTRRHSADLDDTHPGK